MRALTWGYGQVVSPQGVSAEVSLFICSIWPCVVIHVYNVRMGDRGGKIESLRPALVTLQDLVSEEQNDKRKIMKGDRQGERRECLYLLVAVTHEGILRTH